METLARTVCNIVFVTSEAAPYSKTGGLGDVCGSLPIALAKRGHRVMVVSPRYLNGSLSDERFKNAVDLDLKIKVYWAGGEQEVSFFHEYRAGVDWVRIQILQGRFNTSITTFQISFAHRFPLMNHILPFDKAFSRIQDIRSKIMPNEYPMNVYSSVIKSYFCFFAVRFFWTILLSVDLEHPMVTFMVLLVITR